MYSAQQCSIYLRGLHWLVSSVNESVCWFVLQELTVKLTLMNVRQIPVRTAPPAMITWDCTPVSVCRDTRASTVSWTSTSVTVHPANMEEHVWIWWTGEWVELASVWLWGLRKLINNQSAWWKLVEFSFNPPPTHLALRLTIISCLFRVRAKLSRRVALTNHNQCL